MENSGKITLPVALEAILFKLNEPTSLKKLCSILDENEANVRESLAELKQSLSGRGVDLLENNGEYSLVTAQSTSHIIEKMVKEEVSRDLGKASMETLSIILYRGPIARREVDYIRGVNSTFILRSLMVRGLVERVEGETRGPLYRATSELLAHLGMSSAHMLPEYQKVKEEIETIEKNKGEENV